ncbi:MAG TPA: PadR family transcriptional regulator [Ktedonobacterales bacterium]|nr:PadR family transcriptional regulator [Ktedonobacterales bacterium]
MSAASQQRASTPDRLEYALLSLLRREPLHAYEMYQRLHRSEPLGHVWQLKQSHLYALLARLEEQGLIAGATELQEARPPRRMLALTSAGTAAYIAWVTAPVQHGRDFRLVFLAKLACAASEGPRTSAALISRQRDTCAIWQRDLQEHIAAVPDQQPYDRLVLEFRAGQIAAILTWLERCELALLPS